MNNLKVDNSVPRQATFETEPADTIRGRNVKRGGMNIPYIDDKSVKRGKQETLKDKETLKKEQLKALKDKELSGKKINSKTEKELKVLMEKTERELKAEKEKLLKDKEREQKSQREKELKALKERENKAERERDLQLQKEKVQKAKLERDARVAREKEQKLQKEKELKALKEKEIRIQKDKEAKALQDKEAKLRKENEAKGQREREESARREKETLVLREKEQQSKNESVKDLDKTEKPSVERKPGLLQRLGRSLSPRKKDKHETSQAKSSSDNADIDFDRGFDVNIPTPSIRVENEPNSKKVKTSPATRNVDYDSPRYVPQSSRDSLIVSPENETPAKKSSDFFSKTDAWISDRRRSSTPDADQRSKVLRKFNTDSPTRSDSDREESPKRSRRAKYLKSCTIRDEVGLNNDVKEEETKSEFDERNAQEPESYDEILAERDSLLTTESVYKKKIKQLQDEVAQLLEVTEKLDLENKELRWNMDNPSAVNEATNLTKRLQERIVALEEEVNELHRDKKKYMILHNDSERKVTEIEQENDLLKEKMLLYEKDKLPQIEELHTENKKLESVVKHLKAKNKEIDEHFEIMKNENAEISDELRIKRNEVQELLENLKNQKTVELELQKEITRLEARIKKFEEMEGELATQVAKVAVQDAEKEQLQDLIKDKEKEIKEIKEVIDSKDTEIENRKLANELQTEEVEKLKSEIEKRKQNADKIQRLEKEITNLKKTIKTLQDQLDDSLKENKKLKSEAEGSKKKMVRIKEDYDEASKNQSILEAEKKAKVSLEEQLIVSKDEVSSLQQQNMELNIKISNLNERLKSLEEAKEQNGGLDKKKSMAEKLESENRRLRYRLVEKNFAEVAEQSEKAALSSRLEHLEQKQVDNEVKVKQLQGWVDDIYTETSSPRRSPVAPQGPQNQEIPRVAVATQSEKTANKPGKSKRQRAHSPKDVQPRKPENTRLAVSLDDMRSGRDDSRCSTPTLPLIKDIPEQAPIYNSYFYIYKQKQKMMRQQQKIR